MVGALLGLYDSRDAENADGIAGSSHKNIIYSNVECHGMCQSLDELIKSRSLYLNKIAIWSSV